MTLGQMVSEGNVFLNDQQVDDIFQDMHAFVTCLETLYPNMFTRQLDLTIKMKLKEVGS